MPVLQKKMPNSKYTHTFGTKVSAPNFRNAAAQENAVCLRACSLVARREPRGRPTQRPSQAYHQPSPAPDNLEQTRTAGRSTPEADPTDEFRQADSLPLSAGTLKSGGRGGGRGGGEIFWELLIETQRVDLHYAKNAAGKGRAP